MPINPIITLEAFSKWAIDFVHPIKPLSRRIGAWYIITAKEYLTRWAEAAMMKDCIVNTMTWFIFENIITPFGYPKILSDQGSHFMNSTIQKLTKEFMIHHRQSTPYRPQVNLTIEAFNKILEHALTKICNANRDDWDECALSLL